MTVPQQPTRTTHVGNGVTTVFAYDFLCLAARDLQVLVADAVVDPSSYTISDIGQGSGGEVTFYSAPADQALIVIQLDVVLDRQTDYQTNGDLFAQTVNFDFDRIWLALQQAFGYLSRVPRLGDSDVDGAGAYRAKQNRIQDLADPINGQDAANRQWVLQQIGSLATDGSGQVVLDMLADSTSSQLGDALIAVKQPGAGAVARTQHDKNLEALSVLDFGADPTGVADSYGSIMAGIVVANMLGGGVLRCPRGTYRITQPIYLGDGSDSQVSTRDHRITLQGEGIGGHTGLDFVQSTAATEILYDGPTAAGAGVLELRGPLHGLRVEHMTFNAQGKAGMGVLVNHVTDSLFTNVVAKRATANGWLLTTRAGFPSGCVYGTGNNIFLHCWAVQPELAATRGILLTSGVSTASSLTGQPDSANNDFIGGVYFYGGSAASSGVELYGADNNAFSGTQFVPVASPSFGFSVFFRQWPGDTRFPMENVFNSIGSKDPVGGVSGTLGNTFTIFQEGDGAALPLLPNVNVLSHSGVEVVQGKRIWRIRETKQATLSGTNQDTTSATFVPVTPLAATINNVKPGAKIRVTVSAQVGKLVGGNALFVLYINGVAQGASQTSVPFNVSFQNTAMTVTLDATAGGTYAAGMYFSSNDGNIARVTHGVLTMDELY